METEPGSAPPPGAQEKQELLALLLREEGFALREDVPVRPAGGGLAPRPLSAAQERLWLLAQLYPGTPVYNIPAAVQLRGPLDVTALEQSLSAVVARHEALRTTIRDEGGRPAQIVAPASPHQLQVDDLSAIPQPERSARVERIAYEQARYLFDLGAGPLLRTRLLRLGADDHVFLLTLHHIVSDAWSVGVFVREMIALYDAFRAGEPSPLRPLPMQFADVAWWESQHADRDMITRDLTFWRRRLEGIPPDLAIPADRPRPPAPSFRGARVPFALDAELTAALRRLAHSADGTLFVALLAAFATLLHRYTGSCDIVVGTPVANRDRREFEDLIGFFANTLVLRVNLTGNPAAREVLRRAGAVALDAWEHQQVPFVNLVSTLNPKRDPSRTPLFQVMLALQNAPLPAPSLGGLTVEPLPICNDTAKFDLTLELSEDERGLRGFFEYSTELFDPATVTRMAGHLRTLVEGMVAEPDRGIADVPLLTAVEAQCLREWNETETSLGDDACLHELFDEQARRSPDSVAVRFRGDSLSYAQLRRRVQRLARRLGALGVGPEVLVGICLERSPELIVAELAVLQAGGAFVPLEPAYPPERLRFVIEDARVSVVVTQDRFRSLLPQDGIALVTPDPDADGDDEAVNNVAGIPAQRGALRASMPENLAYVIYTSGSTGHPKGAMNCHRAVVNLLRWMQDAYRLTPADRVLQKTPFSFDLSVWELFWPLLTGATMVMCEPGRQGDSAYLAALIDAEGITAVQFVPSMLQQFLREPTVDRCTTLRLVICGGESLSHPVQEQFFSRFDVALENLYGPTEAAIDVTRWSCHPGPPAVVPIGRPIANVTAYVLDGGLGLLPVGVPGELYIGGVAVGRGYVNRPGLTAERFLPDPFSRRPGARMYRTGDSVRLRPDGSIEYLGRRDDQVKVRGFRIEPGEIEAALAKHPSVRGCAVAVREDDGDRRLVAYVVPRGTPASSGGLRRFLKESLPEYLVPSSVVTLDALPVTHNGKLDRRALPAPGRARPDIDTALVEPHDEIEGALAVIWRDVLRLERVGVDDNFFDLGGDSLLLARAHALVRERFGEGVTLLDLFRFPTVRSLAQWLGDGSSPSGAPAADTRSAQLAEGVRRLRRQRERRHGTQVRPDHGESHDA